jgi:hypothetical protein
MRHHTLNCTLTSSAGKKKSRGGPDHADDLNHLHCLESLPRAVTAELRTSESVSLSNSTICGTAPSIALTSSTGKRNKVVGLTVQMPKSLTLLGNFTEGNHSTMAYPGISVLEQLNYVWHHTFNLVDKFHWEKKQEVSRTVKMTKSLTLLGNLSEGKHSKSTNLSICVLECFNNIRNHTLDRLDEFHWKNIKSIAGPTSR